MTECPRCHGANMMKTIFGSFKCPQCLHNGTKLKRKGKRNSSKKREQKTDPFPQCLPEDTAELIEIVTLRKTARIAQLAAIRAMGEKDDPRVIELLSSMSSHPDMDFRRYVREANESIQIGRAHV